jgi:hypothetical protein
MATGTSTALAAPYLPLVNPALTAPTMTRLLGMLSDRTTLLFSNAGFSASQLGVSVNGGATITYGKGIGGGQFVISGVAETLGGELLVSVQDRTGLPGGQAGQLWRSIGWNKTAANAKKAVSGKALTSNVATITLSAAHGYSVGQSVEVVGVDATFNGTFTITAIPSSTSFSYALTAANVASTSAGGTAEVWVKVLTASGPGVIFDGRWSLTQRSIAPAGSPRAGWVFIAEYGSHTNEAATTGAGAVRAWVSKDDARTFTQVFDLRDLVFGGVSVGSIAATAGFHIHSIAYDPWDDRVFLTIGDGGNGDGGYCAVVYCDVEKLGVADAWVSIPAMQSTNALPQMITVVPTPSAVLFTPDSASLGIWRLPRRGWRRYGTPASVAQIGLNIVGANCWQNTEPNAPLFMTYASAAASGPPSILVSTDGATITEAYRAPAAISGSAPGINTCVGPDLQGKCYANYNIDGTAQLLTVEYQPNQLAGGGPVTNVPTTRAVQAGPGISGGGDLSADRTLTKVDGDSPARYGLLGHVYPAHQASSTTTALTGGTLYLMKIVAEDAAAASARAVKFFQNTASSGITLAKVAVFAAAGALLGVSADFSSTINGSANTTRSISPGSFAITKGAEYYVGILVVGTTGPVLVRTSNTGVCNPGLNGAGLLWARGDTGLTDMPSSITPSALNSQPIAMWFGLG